MLGGSAGLVVMGGDSRSTGRGFESQHWILDGHFSHYIVVKLYCFIVKDRREDQFKKQKRPVLATKTFFERGREFESWNRVLPRWIAFHINLL